MSAVAYLIAEPAKLQVQQLPATEKRALRAFFRSDSAASSKAVEGGMRVARLGGRHVLWKEGPRGKPLVLSVVDASYAPKT